MIGYKRTSITVFLLALAAFPAGGDSGTPVGSEFQINTYTTGIQRNQAVAADTDGDFVVVWSSAGSSGSDTSSWSVQGQRFDAAGAPLGNEFQVNTYTTYFQGYPDVAAAADGSFIVVWISDGSSGSDTSSWSIQGQRFDSAGAPLGAEFQVNTYTTSYQLNPAVAAAADGDFIVVWMSDGSGGSDTSDRSIQGQRFDSAGVPLGAEFQVNTYTTDRQDYLDVAADADGDFVVVWESAGSLGSDSSSRSIQGQRFDSAGVPLGGQFQVNTYTPSLQRSPAVAADAAGGFVVVWLSTGSSGSDSDLSSIQGQRFDSTGAPLGAEFQVNTYTTSYQTFPDVAADADGDFVVVWHSDGSSRSDSSDTSVQARPFNSAGTALGDGFQVNTYTTSHQYYAAVAADAAGNFIVVWESDGSSGSDSSSLSVQGQRFTNAIFADSFETGDTTCW